VSDTQALSGTVPFEEDSVRNYLDEAITYWRNEERKGRDIAVWYVDAFQSMRTALFGSTLE
jgi:hypothetical protein